MRNNFFIKTICVILMTALLTFSVGRASRVYAIGTSVAAIAGTAFVATGLIYVSYLALTGASISVPRSADLYNWLDGIGHKVAQYPSGQAAYQEMYEYYAFNEPVSNFIDGVWTWTEDKLKAFINDFCSVGIIGDIVGSYQSTAPLADFDYSSIIIDLPSDIYIGGFDGPYTLNQLLSNGYSFIYSQGYRFITTPTHYIQFWSSEYPVRNIRTRYGSSYVYSIQQFINNTWVTPSRIPATVATVFRNGSFVGYLYGVNATRLNIDSGYAGFPIYQTDFPQLVDMEIYDSSTGELIPALDETQYLNHPNWNNNDDDNMPIVPWVPIPELPSTVPTPSGYNGISQWGFNLDDLLDQLASLSNSLLTLGAIAELINDFAGLHGDQYYIEYNDGDTNYFTYYQPANTYNYDDYYVTNYNIDVSDIDEHLPVDLNTISLYTNNTYVDTVKSSSQKGSTILRDFFVFWHDVDAEIVYVLFGCAIVTLVGAFIGKWGHS